MAEGVAAAPDDYERDVERITHSGPHPIDEERKQKNRQVHGMLHDVLPIADIHKISDCDLIYKFLIARRWDCEAAAKGLREYAVWRREQRLDEILWEEFPPEASALASEFRGFDRFGHPVFYDRPDPKLIGDLLTRFPRETLLRVHFKMMEWGRRLSKHFGTDRVSCVLDLSLLTMGIVTNTRALGFMREMSHMDQAMYPENMRTMLICNGGWSFNALWKVVRPLLDERVQKKIQFMSSANMSGDIDKWVSLDQVPLKYGGNDVSNPRLDDDAAVMRLAVATPPSLCCITADSARQSGAAGAPPSIPLSSPIDGVAAPPNFGSPLLNGAEYDSDEFHSIPSSNDGGDDPRDQEVFVAPSPAVEAARAARRVVSAPLGNVVSGTIQMVVTNEHTPRGRRTSTCAVDGEVRFETSGNLIVSRDGQLKAELLAEAGHPFHTYLLIANEQRNVRFVLKRRNLRKKILIFTVTNDTAVQTTKKMKHTCKGERTHVMTCAEGAHSSDRRDWCISAESSAKQLQRSQAEKRGDVVVFSDMLTRFELHVLFALAVACTELWHFQD